MSTNNSNSKQRRDLVEKIVEMLNRQDPEWRSKPWRPKQAEMAKLAEDAEFLLRAVDSHFQRPIHAYQLFAPEGPLMRVREIEARFKEFGWTEGKSHNTLRPLIRELLSEAQREVSARSQAFAGLLTESPQSSDSTSTSGRLSIGEFLDRLESGAMQLLDELGVSGAVKDPEALTSSVVASIVKQIEMQIDRSSPRRMEEEDPTPSLAVTTFMCYVCAANSVDEFNDRNEHSVRPFELFLFARQENLAEDALWLSVEKLTEGAEQELGRPVSSSLSILESHGGLDEAIQTWLDKNDPQGIEPLEAELP